MLKTRVMVYQPRRARVCCPIPWEIFEPCCLVGGVHQYPLNPRGPWTAVFATLRFRVFVLKVRIDLGIPLEVPSSPPSWNGPVAEWASLAFHPRHGVSVAAVLVVETFGHGTLQAPFQVSVTAS